MTSAFYESHCLIAAAIFATSVALAARETDAQATSFLRNQFLEIIVHDKKPIDILYSTLGMILPAGDCTGT
jgi:hypothetical protein